MTDLCVVENCEKRDRMAITKNSPTSSHTPVASVFQQKETADKKTTLLDLMSKVGPFLGVGLWNALTFAYAPNLLGISLTSSFVLVGLLLIQAMHNRAIEEQEEQLKKK